MANNYYTLPNFEIYENSPAVVNFQRFIQRRDTVQQQQQDVTNSRNSVYQESEPHMAFLKNLWYFSVNHPPRKIMVRARVRAIRVRVRTIRVGLLVLGLGLLGINRKVPNLSNPIYSR